MSSASPEPPRPVARVQAAWRRNTLGLRLTLGYALLFALSAAVLFGLIYALLGQILREQDEAFLRTQLRVIAEAYTADGLAGVRRQAAALRGDDRGEEVLIRVAGADGGTALLVPPDEWEPSDLAPLEGRPAHEERFVLWNEEEGQEAVVLTLRLPDGALLQVGMSSDERDDVLESFPRVFVVVTLPVLLLALLGGAFMAHRALRPVRRLTQTLEAIVATGDVRERAPAPEAQGELADVFRLFNQTLDRIEALVAHLGGTLDAIAHDLRTPITRLRGTAELALQNARDADAYREALAQALDAAEAVTATLDTIMDVAEAEAGALPLHVAPVPLADLAADVADLYGLVAEERGIALDVEIGDPGVAAVDAGRMRQALANLVDNALKYTPAGGRVVLGVDRDAEGVRVTVRDTGPGIAPEELPRIWDRLYRGEASHHTRGLGLGLSLVRAIAAAHGGRVDVASAPGEGTTFTLRLPAAPYGSVRER